MPTDDRVHIPPPVRRALRDEAERALPDECCGLLAGRGGVVEAALPVPNAALQRASRYEMEPAALWAARRHAAEAGLEVIGFYHSHPRTEPVPSPYDVARAYYPDAVYVIVGVEPRPDIRAFRIAGGGFEELALAGADEPDDER